MRPLATTKLGVAGSSKSPFPPVDGALLSELYDDIDQNSPGLEARKMLMQHFEHCGMVDAAIGAARELLEFDPTDREAQITLARSTSSASTSLPPATKRFSNIEARQSERVVLPQIDDPDSALVDLSEGCKSLIARARQLQQQLRSLQKLQSRLGGSCNFEKNSKELDALANGKLRIRAILPLAPPSARSVAQKIQSCQDDPLDTAIDDLSEYYRWHLQQYRSSDDQDQAREALCRRVQAINSALPNDLHSATSTALMHIEHESLKRSYVNDETMLGDHIKDIQRKHFWVSEDGYAWDMTELRDALKAKDGVMRNPLSRQMFSAKDIGEILNHPVGKTLAALHVEQSKLSGGLRQKTIANLEKLSKVLLADMSLDQLASRNALDEFLAYVATLPRQEQRAVDGLHVPAVDSHTGQRFDTTIGEAVRDAQGNRTCMHKTGDFLAQAARHLRAQRKMTK